MATLVLGIAGSAIGGALLPGGLSLLGTPLSGAAIGSALATIGGAFVDQALLGPLTGASGQTSVPQGPRVTDLKLGSSSEGTPLPRVYGRSRVAGQLIWATRFKEKKEKVKTQTAGGKNATGAVGSGKDAKTVKYTYFANVAYAVCEGPIDRIGTIWADGKKLKKNKFDFEIHYGTETQAPDDFLENKEGGPVPGYRGTAYVVFKSMALESFGNRLPVLNFEVIREVDSFEDSVRAVTLIPGAGEFAYATDQVISTGGGVTASENVHTNEGGSDFSVSMDQLEELLPNVQRVALVVTWFGTDLRIGECEIRPGVETDAKSTEPYQWSVSGVTRDVAYVVSESGGRPAYGGTPADAAVVSAIQDLTARGIAVTFYPFIAMDVPAGNSLPNPYGGTGQPPYPWRGRITCDPAPGEVGTVDKTATCATQVAAFVGTAAPGDFSIDGDEVTYSGPDEWSFRRFILHYAHLCEAAGGVDAFIMGSELIGATTLRSSASAFPFIDALVDLAADVKDVLSPGTKLTYGANWTEHPAYVPPDGSGDVYFHLDPLWASDVIDAVGIDVYWPLSDWRDGEDHLDFEPGRTIYDLDYLKGNVRGGEAFDFYYPAAGETGNEASPERIAQTRTAITDGAYGKPWVYKPKAIKEWWQNQHFNRPGGVEDASPTDWVPESKPIWFTELGCPAADKGSNQPNVFIDPKSSESFAPFFSRVTRDDLMQRRYILALQSFFDPDDPDYIAGSNPTSGVYAAPMVDVSRLYVYTWDARPYPAFPLALSVWADGGNWELGHWLTGRVGGGDVAAVVATLLEDYGFTRYDVSGLAGSLDGYVIDRLMSARDALQPLSLAYFIDAHESGGLIHFTKRGLYGSLATVTPDDLVETDKEQPLYTLTRGQETELPLSAKITFVNETKDYAQGSVEAQAFERAQRPGLGGRAPHRHAAHPSAADRRVMAARRVGSAGTGELRAAAVAACARAVRRDHARGGRPRLSPAPDRDERRFAQVRRSPIDRASRLRSGARAGSAFRA
jgi:GTA TIM-barrel-like domain/Putative phage tail protein